MYVWTGFCRLLVAPSPKSQDQEVGVLVDWSVKVTVSGAFPDIGLAEKAATGGVGILHVEWSPTFSTACREEKVEGLFWLLNSVWIHLALRMAVSTWTSSIVPFMYVMEDCPESYS